MTVDNIFAKCPTGTLLRKLKKNDLFKMKKAMENGYTVIRILQVDIWEDKYDWKKKIEKFIHEYDTPECIFLSKGDEYKCFEKKYYQIKKIIDEQII